MSMDRELQGHRFTAAQVRDALMIALSKQHKIHTEQLEALRRQAEDLEAKWKRWTKALSPIRAYEFIQQSNKDLDVWELDALLEIATGLYSSHERVNLSDLEKAKSGDLTDWLDAIVQDISQLEELDFRIRDCLNEAKRLIESNPTIDEQNTPKQHLIDEFIRAYSSFKNLRLEPSVSFVVHMIHKLDSSDPQYEETRERVKTALTSWIVHAVQIISAMTDILPAIETSASVDASLTYICVTAVRMHEDVRRKILKLLDILVVAEADLLDPSAHNSKYHVLKGLWQAVKGEPHCPHALWRIIELLTLHNLSNESKLDHADFGPSKDIQGTTCTFCQHVIARLGYFQTCSHIPTNFQPDTLIGWSIAEGIDQQIAYKREGE